MKPLFITILLATALFSCTQAESKSHENSLQQATFESVSVEKFDSIICDTTGVILLDVRTAQEYADGHIDRAINIDVKRDDFDSIANSTLVKEKTIAVYCRSGRRSKTASEKLANNGYKVVELDSGYNGWTEYK